MTSENFVIDQFNKLLQVILKIVLLDPKWFL